MEPALPDVREDNFRKLPQGERQSLWNETEVRCRLIVDKLGKPIDDGILQSVVALNAFGINTRQSCEGHLDWGIGAPWIDIEATNTNQHNVRLRELAEARIAERAHGALQRLAQSKPDEIKQLQQDITQQNLRERQKLVGYLDEFYQNHLAPFDQRLILQSQALGATRLQSQGADFQEFAATQDKATKLKSFQVEMRAFGDFLKAKFLAE